MIPVLDLRGGQAVHARGGLRSEYRPVRSAGCPTADPLGLATAWRDRFGLPAPYVADLDAIAGGPPDLGFLRRAAAEGLRPWVDAGLRDVGGLDALLDAGAGAVVAATETLSGPDALAGVIRRAGADAVVFGLDLRDGRPVVAPGSAWRSDDPLVLIDRAAEAGARRFLLLDTARVGSGRGVGSLGLVGHLQRRHPGAEVAVGGGVAGPADLEALDALGVRAALVGSALYDGRLTTADFAGRAWSAGPPFDPGRLPEALLDLDP